MASAKLITSFEVLATEYEELNDKHRCLENRHNKLKVLHGTLEAKYANLEKDHEALIESHKAKIAELNNVEHSLETCMLSRDNWQQIAGSLRKNCDEMKTKLEKAERKYGRANSMLEIYMQGHDQCLSLLAEASKREKMGNATIAEQDKEMLRFVANLASLEDQLRAKNQAWQNDVNQLKKDLEDLEVENAYLQEELDINAEHEKQSNLAIEELAKQLYEAELLLEEHVHNAAVDAKSRNKNQEEINKLRERFHDMEEQYNVSMNICLDVEMDLKICENKLASHNANAAKELQCLENCMAARDESIALLRATVTRLTDRIEELGGEKPRIQLTDKPGPSPEPFAEPATQQPALDSRCDEAEVARSNSASSVRSEEVESDKYEEANWEIIDDGF